MSFYGDLAQTADKLLRQFGAVAELQRRAATTYNPDTGEATGAIPAAESIVAAVFDFDEKAIDGTLIQRGDKRAFVSALNGLAEPHVTDKFIWLGEEYTIINHKELAPSGINVLFEWQVRK